MPLSDQDREFLLVEFGSIYEEQVKVLRELRNLKEEIQFMSTDLDAQIAQYTKNLSDLAQDVKDNGDVIAALEQKIAAGQDVSAEVAALKSNNDSFSAALQTIVTSDPTASAPAPQPTPLVPPLVPPTPTPVPPDNGDGTSSS